MQFVLREGCCVRQRLPDVFLLQVGQLLNDLSWRQPIRQEIDDMGDRNAQASDGCTAGQYVRSLRNPIKCLRHVMPAFQSESDAKWRHRMFSVLRLNA